jgi:hypothetical protein
MEGDQYNVALTIFFVSYIIFEVPANMALKYLSPRVWSKISTWWHFGESLLIFESYLDCCVLGACHDSHGHCPQLRGSAGSALHARCSGGRHFPGSSVREPCSGWFNEPFANFELFDSDITSLSGTPDTKPCTEPLSSTRQPPLREFTPRQTIRTC